MTREELVKLGDELIAKYNRWQGLLLEKNKSGELAVEFELAYQQWLTVDAKFRKAADEFLQQAIPAPSPAKPDSPLTDYVVHPV
jgi:hypothetical protein